MRSGIELPPDPMVHTFYLWRCADFTSKGGAKVLGFTNEAQMSIAALAEKTRQAFLKRFFDQEKEPTVAAAVTFLHW
ncbi:MAG: hypothetical protein MZU84_05210 [Sphingobacterium sp.]|nr:hypothetical protein [Sphingobacterium sp.]